MLARRSGDWILIVSEWLIFGPFDRRAVPTLSQSYACSSLSGNKSGGTLHQIMYPAYADITISSTSWTLATPSKLQVSHGIKLWSLVINLMQAVPVAILSLCQALLRHLQVSLLEFSGSLKKNYLQAFLCWSSSGHHNCLLFIIFKWVILRV